jgi:CDP-diacylglycerol--glycerol-3-phosphate 3-phosphatidyltransferase
VSETVLRMMETIGRPFRWLRDKTAAGLAATGVHPNFLTWLILFFNLWAGILFAAGRFAAAGGMMIAAGFFDIVDGPVARMQGRVSTFGGFLDSILDRYADLVLFLGLLIYYSRVNRFGYAVLVGVAMAGAVMVSYAQARAESLIESCRVGFWERPERIVLMILGALANRMPLALWLLAIGPNLTVLHRILYTWQRTEGRARRPEVPRQPSPEPEARSDPQPEAVSSAPRAVLTRTAGHGG